jgi:putative transposase
VVQFVVENGRFWPGKLPYQTDLTDPQWAVIEPLLPKAKPGGRPRTTDLRRVADAILYLVKTGCHWRLLPSDFPPWRTVYEYFIAWRKTGTLRRIHNLLVKKVRHAAGKTSYPTIAILDSQSVKTGKMCSEDKGYDGGKHVKGRKRHVASDILGLPIAISVTSANTHDKVGGARVVERIAKFLNERKLKKLYADGGYVGMPFRFLVKRTLGATVSISKNLGKKIKGFVPIKKRWVIERTFAWLGDYRRLDKDQERKVLNSIAMIRLASICMMLRKLFPTPTW